MSRLWLFAQNVGRRTVEYDLFALANELSYKILLAFFPFVIFLVSLMGVLNVENFDLFYLFGDALPPEISEVVINFIVGLDYNPSGGLLSASLLVSIYSTSNGFRAIVRAINKVHDISDDRSFVRKTGICIVLMLIFALSVIMLALWMFSTAANMDFGRFSSVIVGIVAILLLILSTALIYFLACAKSRFLDTLPGAFATVILWGISSNIFSLFIARYSRISAIYGSLAGIFVLIIWIYLISFFLLLGNLINAEITKTKS
ncbi:MAG: YihY/virulence factor BrkB family protein [Turicibacter sp.]|nr:YihY/virulence factor BrkB family protein [Turicibacter sp.]